MKIVFFNGHFLLADEAKIPISDRGFLFGDGVFATLRVSEGKIEQLEKHLHFLEQQCHTLKIPPPYIDREWLRILIEKNNAFTGSWRLKIIVTGGSFSGELFLSERVSCQFIMTLEPVPNCDKSAMHLTIYPRPISYSTSEIKSLAYLERIYIKEHAKNNRADEIIVLSPEGFVLETAFSNLFWKLDNVVYTPDPSLFFRYGVTIQTIEQVVPTLGLQFKRVKTKLVEISEKSHIYFCNSIAGVCPVTSIDNKIYQRDLEFERCLQKAVSEL